MPLALHSGDRTSDMARYLGAKGRTRRAKWSRAIRGIAAGPVKCFPAVVVSVFSMILPPFQSGRLARVTAFCEGGMYVQPFTSRP